MGFPDPKPRHIEKDVKVFKWEKLAEALTKIISKYVRPRMPPSRFCSLLLQLADANAFARSRSPTTARLRPCHLRPRQSPCLCQPTPTRCPVRCELHQPRAAPARSERSLCPSSLSAARPTRRLWRRPQAPLPAPRRTAGRRRQVTIRTRRRRRHRTRRRTRLLRRTRLHPRTVISTPTRALHRPTIARALTRLRQDLQISKPSTSRSATAPLFRSHLSSPTTFRPEHRRRDHHR